MEASAVCFLLGASVFLLNITEHWIPQAGKFLLKEKPFQQFSLIGMMPSVVSACISWPQGVRRECVLCCEGSLVVSAWEMAATYPSCAIMCRQREYL